MTIIAWPLEPRVGWIGRSGDFLGFSVPFGTAARAAYVVFTTNGWREAKR